MVAAPLINPPPVLTPVPPQADVLVSAVPGYLSGIAGLLADQARQLPVPGDDLQRDFGVRFYDQIALDPQVDAAERILLTAALNAGVGYSIPTPRDAPEYPRAARMQRFVAAAFDQLPRPVEALLYEMGRDARKQGHKLAEVVWMTRKILPNYGPQLIYRDIKPKPLGTYAFVQDGYANTLGITPRHAGVWVYGAGVLRDGQIAGQSVYALDKFPVLTWAESDRDPRGRSAFRTIYGAWWKKRQAEPGLLAYLARFGQPSLRMTLPPNAPDKVPNEDGTFTTSIAAYKAAGLEYQSGGVLVIPNGAAADLQEAAGDGGAYIAAEHLWNQEILMGLTGQTLATSEGNHRSGTDSRTHQDMLGLLVTFIKAWLSDFANRLLVAPLIVANFGEAALPLAPRLDLGRISPEDLASMTQAIAQLAGQGYWDPTRVPPDVGAELDTRMGLPQRQIIAVGPDGTPADQPPATPPGQAGPPPADPAPAPQAGAAT
jgi:hypothetical protein